MFTGYFTVMSDLDSDAANYVDLSDPFADTAKLKAARWDINIARSWEWAFVGHCLN